MTEHRPANAGASDAEHRVLIVDDHPLYREALATALRPLCGATTELLHAESLGAANAVLDSGSCQMVLLDLHMADSESLGGLQSLRSRFPELPIYICSAADDAQRISSARALGASGYLPKTLPADELATALRAALAGRPWFPEATGAVENGDSPSTRVATLTPAQQRVMEGLAEGLLNKQIAHRMEISEATVKAHMTAILRKLGASNRTQALLIYRQALGLTGE